MAEKVHQIHEFECGIYPRNLWITVGAPIDVLRDFFGKDLPEMDKDAAADVTLVHADKPKPRGGVLIRFENRKELNAENICHEAGHAALEIFHYCGAGINYDNQEPFCYLMGWIARMCDKVRRGKYED